MTKEQKKTLLHFLERPGMYIQHIDEINIISFITGYEVGSNNECNFSTLLSEYLDKEFKIVRNSICWPGQLQQYSDKNNIDWITAFKQIGVVILGYSDI